MKTRTLLLLTVLTLSCIQAKADLAPTVMLHRDGVVKTYMYYEVQKAVDDAVDGDTIYLSEGTFQPFNVNKRILVRGTGYTTIIEGSCVIDISGTEKLTMPVLDALTFTGDIEVNSAYKQFTLRKCSMVNLIFNEGEYYDVKIDRCNISIRLNLPNDVVEFNAFNSRIYTLYPHNYTGHAMFEHCNIGNILAPITGGVFNSCALGHCTKLSDATSRVNLIGCVINSCFYNKPQLYYENCTMINCKSESVSYSSGESSEYFQMDMRDSRWLKSDIDGTWIGAYGGQHPFNRDPEVPGVKKHEISIDAATRTMTVKLTVDKLDK